MKDTTLNDGIAKEKTVKRKRRKKADHVYISPRVRAKKLRLYRKENGICTYCGKPVDRDGVLCSKCLAKHSEYNSDRAEMYLSENICPVCGKHDVLPGEKSCKECKAKKLNRQERRMEYLCKYQRERYARFEAEGLCSRCGKRPPEEGKKWCRQCLDRHNKKAKSRRKDVRAQWATDLCCMRCGKPERVEGKKLCPDCYRIAVASMKKCAAKRDKDFNKTWKESNMKMRAHYRQRPNN